MTASAPAASLSVKLCDVFPDGTSALVTRGSLDLAFRGGSTRAAGAGGGVDVLLLDACAYRPDPGPPAPAVGRRRGLAEHHRPARSGLADRRGGSLVLPLWSDSGVEPPSFVPGADSSSEDPADVTWSVTRDVLRRTTTCKVRSVASYDIPHEGTALEDYRGEVGVDRRTFAQWATAETTFRLTWPGVEVRVVSTLRVDIGPDGYDVAIEADAFDDEEQVGHREWRETVLR